MCICGQRRVDAIHDQGCQSPVSRRACHRTLVDLTFSKIRQTAGSRGLTFIRLRLAQRRNPRRLLSAGKIIFFSADARVTWNMDWAPVAGACDRCWRRGVSKWKCGRGSTMSSSRCAASMTKQITMSKHSWRNMVAWVDHRTMLPVRLSRPTSTCRIMTSNSACL